MERDGRIYISTNHTVNDFMKLNLKKRNSSDWEMAIEIFRDRISNRYLNQIKMLNSNGFCNGFSSMAICCLLLDTFYQFEHGLNKTDNNKSYYINFLLNYMGDVFDKEEKAERFYKDIRCGILHSAQTKNGSMLTVGKKDAVELQSDGTIIVDVERFEKRLEEYFQNYCDRIRIKKSTQSNFIKKMKMVCKHPGY